MSPHRSSDWRSTCEEALKCVNALFLDSYPATIMLGRPFRDLRTRKAKPEADVWVSRRQVGLLLDYICIWLNVDGWTSHILFTTSVWSNSALQHDSNWSGWYSYFYMWVDHCCQAIYPPPPIYIRFSLPAIGDRQQEYKKAPYDGKLVLKSNFPDLQGRKLVMIKWESYFSRPVFCPELLFYPPAWVNQW